MQKKLLGKFKILIVLVLSALFVWFLVLSPMITFHNNEKTFENAAKRYFELNSDKLPTGERVKTLSLNVLFKESYLKEDFKVPYSGKVCSLEKSWVKVRKENGEYKYYTYLDCGVLKSSIDHKGPEIKLNGESEVSVNIGDRYKDAGVNSVVDDNDGKLKVDDVVINNKVDTSKVGTYEVKYTAYDNLNNKTVVVRVVKVVKKINKVVSKALGNTTNYVGEPENNYVRLSNVLFRIYGLDSNKNVILVANEDISNVNYSKLEKWLDNVYYESLNSKAKSMIVKTKYCNMTLTENDLDTTQCTGYTDKRTVYIPSVIDVNKAEANGANFMKTNTMSWVANTKDSKNAYLTRNFFFDSEYGKSFLAYSVTDNYGVRPMLTIKGSSLVVDGTGTIDDPYTFGDVKVAKGGTLLNKRYTGEYISSGNKIWRIINVDKDGTTKVIMDGTLNDEDGVLRISTMGDAKNISYNPKQKNNVAYYINNSATKYVDTSLFVNHEIKVPIYKKKIVYGAEVDTKTYKVKLSAPDMFDMFSAQSNNNFEEGHDSHSYWLVNSPKSGRYQGAIFDIGAPVNDEIDYYEDFGIRPVAYVKSDAVITSGRGIYTDPYVLK